MYCDKFIPTQLTLASLTTPFSSVRKVIKYHHPMIITVWFSLHIKVMYSQHNILQGNRAVNNVANKEPIVASKEVKLLLNDYFVTFENSKEDIISTLLANVLMTACQLSFKMLTIQCRYIEHLCKSTNVPWITLLPVQLCTTLFLLSSAGAILRYT